MQFPPGLPSRTIAWTVSSELLGFCFYFFLIFSFCPVRWIKLAISSAFERTLTYRIVSHHHQLLVRKSNGCVVHNLCSRARKAVAGRASAAAAAAAGSVEVHDQ